MWGKSYGWGWQLNPTWAERRLWVGSFCPCNFLCPGDLWEVFGVFLGAAGLGSPIIQEDDQTMEIWPAGLRSALGHGPSDFWLWEPFNGLFSDFGHGA